MKRARFFVIGLVATVWSLSTLACNRSHNLPDYSKWAQEPPQKIQAKIQAMRNDQAVSLVVTDYQNVDISNYVQEFVTVLDDENEKPWLLFYEFVKFGSDFKPVKFSFNMFEYKKGKWVHVKDFTNSGPNLGKDTEDLLKNRYNLVLHSF